MLASGTFRRFFSSSCNTSPLVSGHSCSSSLNTRTLKKTKIFLVSNSNPHHHTNQVRRLSLQAGVLQRSTLRWKKTPLQINGKTAGVAHLSTTTIRCSLDDDAAAGQSCANVNVNVSNQMSNSSNSDHTQDVQLSGSNTEQSETHGQPLHRFGSSYKLEQASSRFDVRCDTESSTANYQTDVASVHHADVYNHMPSVNLSGVMQSQVPEPYGKTPTHMNMPGGINRREDKYLQGKLSDFSGSREFSTSTRMNYSYKLDEHGNMTYNTENIERILNDPCPQGIQGEDCDQFKLWLSNCLHHGDPEDCEKLANEYIAGRKTLAQIFQEYDIEIARIASSYSGVQQVGGHPEHVAVFSSSATTSSASNGGVHASESPSESNDGQKPPSKNSRAARLKAAVKDYGSTVIVFHVGISLVSLGLFYIIVASNVDVESILAYLNITLGSAQSSVETASTFAVAYAVHKIFAPVRIGITLTCAPFIVRSLRARGVLKTPPRPPTST